MRGQRGQFFCYLRRTLRTFVPSYDVNACSAHASSHLSYFLQNRWPLSARDSSALSCHQKCPDFRSSISWWWVKWTYHKVCPSGTNRRILGIYCHWWLFQIHAAFHFRSSLHILSLWCNMLARYDSLIHSALFYPCHSDHPWHLDPIQFFGANAFTFQVYSIEIALKFPQ